MAGTFKKIRRRLWLILNICVVLWVLLGVYCMQVPPYEAWPAAFVAFSLPGALTLNFLFLLYWILRRSWFFILPLLVVILGWNYYARLVPVHISDKEIPEGAKTLQVLSYNTHLFNVYGGKGEEGRNGSSEEMIDWIATHPADVYCLQEFYTNRKSDTYNTVNRIGTRYDKYKVFSVSQAGPRNGEGGIAIFSKYPIVAHGDIRFHETSHNRVAWADLDVGGDTIRVYASHLQSMSIKPEDIENTYSSIGNQAEMEKEGRNVARRLRSGFVARGHQVELLLEHIQQSPYPVIVCGDFNDIPFSYTYNELAKELNNAFVQAGSGIGATYNGPLPFLRIDNQFYSDRLQAYAFETHYEMGLSDHFPISGKYVIEPKPELE
ncbi:endonuclease/exonuclease/phosphatase family protein [Pontibacter silvestris]|uniref:Endonuclease/exonuclease/phosphatase family protein n=1 Tax=Pontibacter silvestris TaxID=2305183 RepID=A0ABW4WX07_9BACT|nr:endonuclease/exonuclease/phosphatase family protein [Pontibacter silvestris]MCC9136357.1 endonuclease/exonuclease/phosphatase family protein [Pontibacter silvestris]